MSMKGLNGFCPASRSRALGDVDRVVADPLQVVVDLQRRHEEPQVHGDRLLQGEQLDGLLLDDHLHAVDLGVGGDDAGRLLRVDLRQRLDRALDLALDLSAHQDQVAPQVLRAARKNVLSPGVCSPFSILS